MNVIPRSLYAALLVLLGTLPAVHAEDISLLPKYGEGTKTPEQVAADRDFLNTLDKQFKGDRRSAALDVAQAGWVALRAADTSKAMHRFNEAWLLDHHNLEALWGMAVIEMGSRQIDAALKLFIEADALNKGNLAFAIDYARALSIIGAQTRNQELLKDAFKRFAAIYSKDPQQVQNLQNWAVALFYTGDYVTAWQKVQLAEATADRAMLDPNFITALSSKMARPTAQS